MKRNSTEFLVLAGLLFSAPLAILVPVNLWRWISGRGFEPLSDNLIGYIVILVIFSAAALAAGAYRFLCSRTFLTNSILGHATAGAVGSGSLLMIADLLDDYFWPGFSGLPMALGGIVGFLFGTVYVLLCRRALTAETVS